jgi:hypothetical protein
MAHQVVVTEEHYIFKPETKKKLFLLLIVGAVLFALGLVLAISVPAHHEETKGGHAALQNSELVASVQQHAAASEGHGAAEHHETAPWKKRLFSSLWMNNVFFAGMGIIGLFLRCYPICCPGWMVCGSEAYRHCDGHLDSDCRYTDAYPLVCNESRSFPLDTYLFVR